MTIITVVAILFLLGTHACVFQLGRIIGRKEGFPRLQKATHEYLDAIGQQVGLQQRHGESSEQYRQRIKDQMRGAGRYQ